MRTRRPPSWSSARPKRCSKTPRKAHNKAVAKTYKLVRNLLSGDLQTQYYQICHKMDKRDLRAGVNGQMTTGQCPCLWIAFQDCLELYKLTVFTADTAKRQRHYIQQAVHKPQRATVHHHILHMGVLNDHVKYLSMLKDSPKIVEAI
jgi:hypothetical protein